MRLPARVILHIILASILFCGVGAVGGAAADLIPQPGTNTPIPKRGGTLRLALPTDVSSLDPALAFDGIAVPFVMLLYQGLVEYGDGISLVPCPAKDWAVSEDLRNYTFHLQPGMRFSTGREVVASDFVFTLERTLDPKMAALTESFFEGQAAIAAFEGPGGRWDITVHFAEAPDEASIRELVGITAGDEVARAISFDTVEAKDWVKATLEELVPVRAGDD